MRDFNLEEYEKDPKGKRLITRRGFEATIVATNMAPLDNDRDVKSLFNIGYLEHTVTGDVFHTCTNEGKRYATGDSEYDLLFAPKYHEGWVNIYRNPFAEGGKIFRMGAGNTPFVYPDAESAKNDIVDRDRYSGTCKIEWMED